MFFYLLYNSTILEKEIDEYNRSIKVLIYGSIAYIILHAVLFIGGEEALLYSLKVYFWLFLALDFIVLGLMFNRRNENSNIFEMVFNRNKKNNLDNLNLQNNANLNSQTQNNHSNINSDKIKRKSSLKRKTVRFKDYESDSDSDSDSDIGTDIDLTAFKESLIN